MGNNTMGGNKNRDNDRFLEFQENYLSLRNYIRKCPE